MLATRSRRELKGPQGHGPHSGSGARGVRELVRVVYCHRGSGLGLENVRSMSWRGLHHMMALAVLAMTTTIALATLEPPQWRTEVIHQGRSRAVDAAAAMVV